MQEKGGSDEKNNVILPGGVTTPAHLILFVILADAGIQIIL